LLALWIYIIKKNNNKKEKRRKDCLQSAPSHYAGAQNSMFQIPNV
jgi:hypothetical protein